MSNRRLCARVRVALTRTLTILPLAGSLACASRGGVKDPDSTTPEYRADTSQAGKPGQTIESMFAGKFSGVTVRQAANGGLEIRIRGGSTSFYGGEEPLYVVDGTPLAGGNGGIVFLNPNDIGKIEVLKNPADTGIYGIRGANGVILITTKRP